MKLEIFVAVYLMVVAGLGMVECRPEVMEVIEFIAALHNCILPPNIF